MCRVEGGPASKCTKCAAPHKDGAKEWLQRTTRDRGRV
jgi:hypothetical protein